MAFSILTRFSTSTSSPYSSALFFNHFSKRIIFTIATKKKSQPQSYKVMASSQAQAQNKITAPYGSWKSPITADVVSGSCKRLGGTAVDSQGHLFWLESRPSESGRGVLVKEAEKPGDEPIDITPKEFAVRTVAQEYGGGAFRISGDTVVFSNYKDQRLYKQSISSKDSCPVPITPDYGGPVVSYADGIFDSRFNRYITVMEDRRESSINATTTITAVPLDGGNIQEPKVLVSGNDFYAFPHLDAKGERMAWIEWSHPNMPWDKAELWVGYISENGEVYKRVCVAGCNPKIVESPTEPKWSPTGELFFVTDRNNGFWNLHKWTSWNNYLYVEGASAVHPSSVAKVTLDGHGVNVADFRIVWSSSPDSLKYESYFSLPELIEFPTDVPGQNAYAYYYPPSNSLYQATQEEKPPLLLKSHGGPTSETRGILNLSIQYWTSRGWAFVDVNYGGSTGYGREYRERLLGRWGIADVDDCCNCARFLVENGKADVERLCITGGSAGGYTTLAALAFRDTFKAGASLYGVADLNLLRAETHKFESHYLDNLVGSEKAYYERSPINFVDKFSCPIILFQGLEDKVVPPDQARKIYQALKEKGLPVALVEYEGEQHGFRKAENIKFTLEQQMVFFARLVGRFNVADPIIPIKIDNFD
ncbi:hypothetical protein PTKIN_Ptkin13bG0038200 [Pterospermum kingtungense]